MSEGPDDELLFTYGTLQFAEVQLDTFGRIVAGEGDTLPCYTIDYTEITDQRVVDVSGLSVHPVIRHTGNPLDKVVGKVLHVTLDEIDAADEYEVQLYRRERVMLGSGRSAWVYVG
ncbi:gamma-glutamylcyclotransferase family protein [Microbacterium memoriense]|uniref:Gamma-glutamylcyclotransferase n=1 Tax=Microbacterium memoriense TaxID=2978350 RepID=A0ABT2P8K4_9MICO|nr:gamma-glutamylcyclotransferase family protein [Microbacterium memoriense]MCT9000991.1 gamma-glutamylcyclotransferase [Microbacterium memoriense]